MPVGIVVASLAAAPLIAPLGWWLVRAGRLTASTGGCFPNLGFPGGPRLVPPVPATNETAPEGFWNQGTGYRLPTLNGWERSCLRPDRV